MIESLGQYKILESLGSGAFGDVYRARDTRVGRTVAIKVLPDRIASNAGLRERFLEDARAAAAVSHPNIVALYEVSEEGSLLYLVHEFIQGQTLKTVISGRPLNPRRAIDLAAQIADALADAHANRLVHGGITAETIVVTPKGNAKIADCGLARWAANAPEQTSGEPAAYGADIFSVGVILFEMLTGQAPAAGAGVPSAVNRSLPREIDPIVARALGKSGGYEAAVTLAAELRAIGAMLDIRMEASQAAAAAITTARRKRSHTAWIVFAVVAAAVAAALWWYFMPA